MFLILSSLLLVHVYSYSRESKSLILEPSNVHLNDLSDYYFLYETGDTPLHECVKNGMLSCIQALLRKGSDVNHKNLQGFSPLHIAVRAGEKFSMDILRELVTKGYNTDVNIPESLGKYVLA